MESNGRKSFPEDIFADDNNEKWSWPLRRTSSISASNVSNYDIHPVEGKGSSNSPSSEEDLTYKGDSSTNSTKRSFRKRELSSASEGCAQEDGSSSPLSSLPHERLLPSIYDDDAQSGSPSGVFENKDLAFKSSFKTEFNSLQNKHFNLSPLNPTLNTKPVNFERETLKESNSQNRSVILSTSPKKDSKDATIRRSPADSKSLTSSSRDDRRHPRSRSRSRDRKGRSEQGRSRSKEKQSEKRRYSSSRRSRSPKGRSRSPRTRRSRSPRSKRSPSRESRRRSRDRRRSRSRSYERRHRSRRSSSRDRYRRRRYSRSRSRDRSRGNRKPGSLPLSSSGGAMTPQMALQQTMAAMSAKAQAMTGIALPKYYNPAAVNPLKYAEQVQKRKLLWQTKEKEVEQPKNTVWDKLTFDQDQDGKMTAKFRKLMGIKSDGGTETLEAEPQESPLQRQAELFRDLDQQYEMARVTTHTQRGVGLGYSATTLYPPAQK